MPCGATTFWQNVVHWRREWQTTSVFLPWEPHEQYKRQNDRILKEELSRLVNAQYATGDQWRNNSRKNEGMESKWKQYPVVDVTGDRRKVWCCKEQQIFTWGLLYFRDCARCEDTVLSWTRHVRLLLSVKPWVYPIIIAVITLLVRGKGEWMMGR